MPINSRRKGKKAEKTVVGLLQKWTKKKFASTPASGGLNWRNSNAAGDVVCTTEGHYFPFTVEVKSYAKIDFSHLLQRTVNADILTFWAQAKKDAAKVGKIPLLLIRYNNLPKDFYFLFIDSRVYSEFPLTDKYNTRLYMTFWDKDKDIRLTIMPSPDFFKMKYKPIKLIAKKLIKDAKTKG